MAKTIIELTERFSEPLPKGFILKLFFIRLTKVKICHLQVKGFFISDFFVRKIGSVQQEFCKNDLFDYGDWISPVGVLQKFKIKG